MLGASICFFLAAICCFGFVFAMAEQRFRESTPVENDEPGSEKTW